MKILMQLSFILSLWLIGELVSHTWHIPIPGNVMGMVLLFLLLSLGIVKVERLKEVADFFLNNLAFFFVPFGVGILNSLDIIRGNWWEILLIVLISTFLVILFTGLTLQLLAKGRGK